MFFFAYLKIFFNPVLLLYSVVSCNLRLDPVIDVIRYFK